MNATSGNIAMNGFTGHEKDFESRYMAMGVRQYDPKLGRFLSVDPLFDMFPDQTPYHYCYNSPLIFSDPRGMAPETVYEIVEETNLMFGNNIYLVWDWEYAGETQASPLVPGGKIFRQVQRYVGCSGSGGGFNPGRLGKNGLGPHLSYSAGSPGGSGKNSSESADDWINKNKGKIVTSSDGSKSEPNIESIAQIGEKVAKGNQNNTFWSDLEYSLPLIGDAKRASDCWNNSDYLGAVGWELFGIFQGVTFGSSYLYSKGYKISFEILESLLGFGSSKIVLNSAVKINYNRFVSKIPANSKSNAFWKLLDDGNYLFEATSAGKVPGSRAIYQKWVNPQGETIKMIKTTLAPDGSIIHIKTKF